MSEMSTGTIIGFVVIGGISLTSFGLWVMRLSPGPGAMFLKKTEDNAAPDIGVGGPLGGLAGGLPIPGGAALGGLSAGLASKIQIPGGAALGGLSAGLASKIQIPGGAAALTGLASSKMPSNIEMSTFSKGDNPLTAMAANPLSAVAGGKLPDMSETNPLEVANAMAANKANAVVAEQTVAAEKAVAEQTVAAEKAVAEQTVAAEKAVAAKLAEENKEIQRKLRADAAENRKKLQASIPPVSNIIPSRVNNITSVGKDGTIIQIPKLTGKADTSKIFTYGEGNVTNTPSSNNNNSNRKQDGGKKTKSKRTKLTKVDSKVKKSVKRQRKPKTKKCLIEKDNKMYMSFCI